MNEIKEGRHDYPSNMEKIFLLRIEGRKQVEGKVQAEHGWQTKQDHERREGEGEQERSKEVTQVKRPRDWSGQNG